jgi:hypothetical protein
MYGTETDNRFRAVELINIISIVIGGRVKLL